MIKITKKEAVFFRYFSEMIEMTHTASVALENLMNDYTDVQSKIKAISEIEHSCDLHVHTVMKTLNAAFITPIDREDIFLIAKEIDNIIDHIEETAHRFVIYNVKEVKPESKELAHLITVSIVQLKIIFDELIKMKHNGSMFAAIIEVNKLENQGDDIYRDELTKLFKEEENPVDVIRWQGILSYLEKALDACEDVANIVEGVVMKHA